ncbi:MAG: GAF domain-containing protein [Nitriliruptoraceae bacterium]
MNPNKPSRPTGSQIHQAPDVPALSSPQAANERTANELLEDLAALARRLSNADSVDELLQLIVDLGEDYVDGCDGVSLMLIDKKRNISTPAYSSKVAYESDLAQYKANEGPCLDALRDHAVYLIDDLETEERWPTYRALALKLGVRSRLSYRLYANGRTYGALDFYAQQPNVYSPFAQGLSQVFAAFAAVALKGAITKSWHGKVNRVA